MLAFAAALALAFSADTVAVRGTVFDSIAAHPIAGASVQLARVDSAHTTERFAVSTDSAGAFTIRGVPAGRYLAGFYHPLLDSLGLELPDRVIDVSPANHTIALATPSPATLVRGFCGDSSSVAPTLLFGHAHDRRTESGIENASVDVTWSVPEQTDSGLVVADRSGQTTTHRGGVFALCGVPVGVPLIVRVSREKDGAVVNVRVPQSGVLHVTVAVGVAGATGRVVGHVVDQAKRPVATAQISIAEHGTAVNDAGAFSLDGVPTGTQSIDVRAIGYAPASVLVDVPEGRATNVDVSLERVVMLPGVVARDSAASVHLASYQYDKRTVAVAAQFVEQTRIPGYKAGLTACQLVTKASGRDYCKPVSKGWSNSACDAIVVNGAWTMLSMDDIDGDDIIGVEYFPREVPAKYDAQFKGKMPAPCHFIIWTRCAGSAIPACGNNPESNPLNRPPEDDDAIDLRRDGR